MHVGGLMHVVGLTGGIGSGKSTVARLFGKQGVHWVDADDVARQVVEPGTDSLARIADHFGDRILMENGGLDRAKLRALVFQSDEERAWLEQLLHPVIRQEIRQQLQQPQNYELPYVMLVSPLLLETDQHELVDKTVVVDVPVATQIARTVARDANTTEQVERIIAAQIPREIRLASGDHLLDNSETPEQVEVQVLALHRQWLNEFQPTP